VVALLIFDSVFDVVSDIYFSYCFLFIEFPAPTIILSLLGLYVFLSLFKFRFNRHKHNVKVAKKAINKIKTIQEPAKRLLYLRKVDPYVFEELVLTSLKNNGYKIKRNKRYSGDGGIDGKVFIDGKLFFVQSKRYKGHITLRHVKDFSYVCEKHNAFGLFVHTGKTGKGVRDLTCNRVKIISGDRLIQLIVFSDFNRTMRNSNSKSLI
jgi:restriction system protein